MEQGCLTLNFRDMTIIHGAEMGFLGAVYGWKFIDTNRSEHTA
jgi:hypothetical protein